LLWENLEESKALELIEEQRLPNFDELNQTGSAKVITAIIASDTNVLSRIWREFLNLEKGNTLLFERHYFTEGAEKKRFGWVDRNGKVKTLQT
jgi:hypothetical protein